MLQVCAPREDVRLLGVLFVLEPDLGFTRDARNVKRLPVYEVYTSSSPCHGCPDPVGGSALVGGVSTISGASSVIPLSNRFEGVISASLGL